MNISIAWIVIILILSICLTGLIVWIVLNNTVIRRKNEELRKAKSEAEKAKLAKSRFLSNMSGEMRNPINTIIGLNQMAQREDTDGVPKAYLIAQKSYSDGIKKASESLRDLINNLFDMAAIENGNMYLLEQEYDTVDFNQFVVGHIKKNCMDKELTLDVSIDEMLPRRLYGDIAKIKQIIMNLLTNGVKYTNEGGVYFTVSLDEREGDYCTISISVKDTGIGIKKEEVDKLFHAYGQLDNNLDEEVARVGLGLDVSRRFAEFLGGSLSCKSVYGEGSEFIFKIKQRIVDARPIGVFVEVGDDLLMEDYYPEFVAPDGDILLVDENRENINILVGLLKPTRVFVTTAASMDEGVKMIKRTHFNVVLIDSAAPGFAPEENIRQIRDIYEDIPVYVLSSWDEKGEKYYKSLGYNGFVTKPIDGKWLEKTISGHLPKDIMEIGFGEW